MKRKLLICASGALIVFGGLSIPMSDPVLAFQKNTELEKEKQEVQEKKSNVESEISEKKDAINEVNQEISNVEKEIKELNIAVSEIKSKIENKKTQIKETGEEIERIEKEMVILEERIEERDKLVKERLRTLQESGGAVKFLDVLFGAKNFNDFINRLSAVSTLLQADEDIINEHQKDITLLEENQIEVKNLLAERESQLTELDNLESQLKVQIEAQNKKMEQLKVVEEEMHSDLKALEDVDELLAAQEKAIQLEIDAWNRNQSGQDKQQNNVTTSGETSAAPVVSNGVFMNPTTGRLTSQFGMRYGSMHFGIDIGKGGRPGNIPIVAAASGTVSRSRLESSYGNVIMITHYINGKQMTTVYAHMQERFVNQYDRVEKGQLIGYMGNTGDSTGPHLHFEIYEGPYSPTQYRGGPSNAVNPLKYVNF